LNFNLIEIINAVFSFTMNDEIKRELFQNKDLIESLKQTAMLGNEIEVEYTMKLLFQFAHDDLISQSLLNDKELNDMIQTISHNQNANLNLEKYSQSMIWLMNKRSIQNYIKHDQTQPKDHTYKIMISSDIQSRKFCIDLKKLLQNEGKIVYFRDELLIGYDLEEILATIMDSDHVVICNFLSKYL